MMLDLVGEKVLLYPDAGAKVTKGGLIIPGSVREKAEICRAYVLEVGPDVKRTKPGDWVYYPSKSVRGFFLDEKQFVELDEKDLVGIEREGEYELPKIETVDAGCKHPVQYVLIDRGSGTAVCKACRSVLTDEEFKLARDEVVRIEKIGQALEAQKPAIYT